MVKKIQYGNLFVEVPDDHIISSIENSHKESIFKNEKSDIPEKLEESPVIFNPYNPATVGLAQASALSNIEKTNKPWINKAFNFVFIGIICGSIDILLISLALEKSTKLQWATLIIFNLFVAYLIFPYSIRFRKKQTTDKLNHSIDREG